MPTYTDEALTIQPKLVEGIGYTFDPLRGGDFWECPFCRSEPWHGCYDALRKHLTNEHNLRVVDQALELRVGRVFDDDGQVIRYEPNVGRVSIAEAEEG